MPKPLSPAQRVLRKKSLKKLLGSKVSKNGVNHLMRERVTPGRVRARIKAMKDAGMPLTNLVKRMSISEERFNAAIEHFKEHGQLSPLQADLKALLQAEGVSKTTIEKLLGGTGKKHGKRFRVKAMEAKIKHLRSIKLDPAIYGVERIPVRYFEPVLGRPISAIRTGITRQVLRPLAEAHARRQLNKIVPGWQNVEILKACNPATIYQRAKAALKVGIKPSPTVLAHYSVKSIKANKAKSQNQLDPTALGKAVELSIIPAETFPGNRRRRSTNERDTQLRWMVVDAMTARPHLTVNTAWLRKTLIAEEGIKPVEFELTVNHLMAQGVISKQNGYISVNTLFRTNTRGPTEHRAKIDASSRKRSASSLAREARRRAARQAQA